MSDPTETTSLFKTGHLLHDEGEAGVFTPDDIVRDKQDIHSINYKKMDRTVVVADSFPKDGGIQPFNRVCFIPKDGHLPLPEVSSKLIILYRPSVGRPSQRPSAYGPSIYGETYVAALIPQALVDLFPAVSQPLVRPNANSLQVGDMLLVEVYLRLKKGLKMGRFTLTDVLRKGFDLIVYGSLSATSSQSINLTLTTALLEGHRPPQAEQGNVTMTKADTETTDAKLRDMGLV